MKEERGDGERDIDQWLPIGRGMKPPTFGVWDDTPDNCVTLSKGCM